jgi:hypothetical protein
VTSGRSHLVCHLVDGRVDWLFCDKRTSEAPANYTTPTLYPGVSTGKKPKQNTVHQLIGDLVVVELLVDDWTKVDSIYYIYIYI